MLGVGFLRQALTAKSRGGPNAKKALPKVQVVPRRSSDTTTDTVSQDLERRNTATDKHPPGIAGAASVVVKELGRRNRKRNRTCRVFEHVRSCEYYTQRKKSKVFWDHCML